MLKQDKRSKNAKVSRRIQDKDEDTYEANDKTPDTQPITKKPIHQTSKTRAQRQEHSNSDNYEDKHDHQLTFRGRKHSIPKAIPEEQTSKRIKINERKRLNGDEQNKASEKQVLEIMQVIRPIRLSRELITRQKLDEISMVRTILRRS